VHKATDASDLLLKLYCSYDVASVGSGRCLYLAASAHDSYTPKPTHDHRFLGLLLCESDQVTFIWNKGGNAVRYVALRWACVLREGLDLRTNLCSDRLVFEKYAG
jgi:hypothetical protein